MNAIDLHSHVIPPTIVDVMRRDPARFGMKIEARDGKLYFERRGKLSEMVGADRVVIGADNPFNMGYAAPLAALDAIPGLTADERGLICSRTAHALLGEESDSARK